ncbi:hypothetical protein ADUPG1_003679, partial [Aduncisulcus paluster]
MSELPIKDVPIFSILERDSWFKHKLEYQRYKAKGGKSTLVETIDPEVKDLLLLVMDHTAGLDTAQARTAFIKKVNGYFGIGTFAQAIEILSKVVLCVTSVYITVTAVQTY